MVSCAGHIGLSLKWLVQLQSTERPMCHTPSVTPLFDKLGTTEFRFISMGLSSANQLLVVAYTERGERIRIISARPATVRERKQYESGT